MSFSYSGQPGSNALDAVRFLLADTDPASALLQDEEITWLLAENIGIYSAAAQAASQLSARFSRQAGSKRMGDLSVTFTTRAKEFNMLAKSLNVQAMRSDLVPMPYAGGISEADKLNDDLDVDVVKRLKVSRIPDIYLVP